MNYDEFAFFNQQLAAMVRDGIPLESSMRRLCSEMRRGSLRAELEKLGEDLSKGLPLRDAVKNRQLPDLYRQMLEIGAQSNDLPGLLTLLADHYQRRQVLTTKLKGLMVYPAIVLGASLILSFFLTFLVFKLTNLVPASGFWESPPSMFAATASIGPVVLSVCVLAVVVLSASPAFRRAIRWRLPAFKEAQLARVASAISLMLTQGLPLDKVLELIARLEHATPAAQDIQVWRQRLSKGSGKLADMTATSRVFPPLFLWVIGQAGEDLATGFRRAAEIYQARATYQADTLLYSALPCSILLLAIVIISQLQPIESAFISFITFMSN